LEWIFLIVFVFLGFENGDENGDENGAVDFGKERKEGDGQERRGNGKNGDENGAENGAVDFGKER